VFIIGVRKTISNLRVEDAVEKISESKYGLHCLVIYPNLEIFRKFYIRYIRRQINLKNEIIMFNPFYETVGTARQNLSMGYIQMGKSRLQGDILLIISDSLNQNVEKVPISEFTGRLLKLAIEKRKKGVSILSDMGSYFFKMLNKELIDYEFSLPVQFDMPLKGICVYNEIDFVNRLTEKQKLDMINHHGMAIKLESVEK